MAIGLAGASGWQNSPEWREIIRWCEGNAPELVGMRLSDGVRAMHEKLGLPYVPFQPPSMVIPRLLEAIRGH